MDDDQQQNQDLASRESITSEISAILTCSHINDTQTLRNSEINKHTLESDKQMSCDSYPTREWHRRISSSKSSQSEYATVHAAWPGTSSFLKSEQLEKQSSSGTSLQQRQLSELHEFQTPEQAGQKYFQSLPTSSSSSNSLSKDKALSEQVAAFVASLSADHGSSRARNAKASWNEYEKTQLETRSEQKNIPHKTKTTSCNAEEQENLKQKPVSSTSEMSLNNIRDSDSIRQKLHKSKAYAPVGNVPDPGSVRQKPQKSEACAPVSSIPDPDSARQKPQKSEARAPVSSIPDPESARQKPQKSEAHAPVSSIPDPDSARQKPQKSEAHAPVSSIPDPDSVRQKPEKSEARAPVSSIPDPDSARQKPQKSEARAPVSSIPDPDSARQKPQKSEAHAPVSSIPDPDSARQKPQKSEAHAPVSSIPDPDSARQKPQKSEARAPVSSIPDPDSARQKPEKSEARAPVSSIPDPDSARQKPQKSEARAPVSSIPDPDSARQKPQKSEAHAPVSSIPDPASARQKPQKSEAHAPVSSIPDPDSARQKPQKSEARAPVSSIPDPDSARQKPQKSEARAPVSSIPDPDSARQKPQKSEAHAPVSSIPDPDSARQKPQKSEAHAPVSSIPDPDSARQKPQQSKASLSNVPATNHREKNLDTSKENSDNVANQRPPSQKPSAPISQNRLKKSTDSENQNKSNLSHSAAIGKSSSCMRTVDVIHSDKETFHVAVRFPGKCPMNERGAPDSEKLAEYITDISEFRLDESIIKIESSRGRAIGAGGIERFSVQVICPSKLHAEQFAAAINDVSHKTFVTAAICSNDDDLEIERGIEAVQRRAAEQIDIHRRKLAEVNKELVTLNAHIKKGNKFTPLEEWERRKVLQKPLESKKQELELQEQGFNIYVDKLVVKMQGVRTLGGDAHETGKVKEAIDKLRFEFGLEVTRFESCLPIYAYKSDIIQVVSRSQVSIILGETGSGKSTQMLQYLHEAGLDQCGRIVCTQPRKVAAISLAQRVAQELGGRIGGLVGYKVGMQSIQGPETRLFYMTDHALLNDSLRDQAFAQYSCIIIDEAHERSIYTDLLLGFIKRALPERPDLRIIITSATIDPDVFVRYFRHNDDTGTTDSFFNPVILKVSGRTFPVDVDYIAQPIGNADAEYIDLACNKVLEIHRSEPPGDILIFLTSSAETERACKMMQKKAVRADPPSVVLELHGRLPTEAQQKVFNPTHHGERKIVFATNMAETSITIPGVRYVIDTGRVREIKYDGARNMSSLELCWTTKSSAEQRKGRAGRTQAGRCYRLYSQEDFKTMRDDSVPEILRIHVGQALLKIMSLGIAQPMDFDFVQAPTVEALNDALSLLQQLGASDENGITEIGRQLAKLTVEPRLGKVALLGLKRGIPYEALIMAAVTSVGGSIFFRVGSEEEKMAADRRKTQFCDKWGDIVTLVNVYREWESIPDPQQSKWCVSNSINAKSMRQARDNLKDLLQTFRQDLGVSIKAQYRSQSSVQCQDLTNGCEGQGHIDKNCDISVGVPTSATYMGIGESRTEGNASREYVDATVPIQRGKGNDRVGGRTSDEIKEEDLNGSDVMNCAKFSPETVEDVNAMMARILFECYVANLSRFSGHRETGYCVARLPSTTLHIHPSSALNYIDDSPHWVVYESVLTTSRPFLLNATYVDESWIIDLVSTGQLLVSVEHLAAQLLRPIQIMGVGVSVVKKLKANRAQELKELKDSIQTEFQQLLSPSPMPSSSSPIQETPPHTSTLTAPDQNNLPLDSKLVIDVFTVDSGSLEIYATPNILKIATDRVKAYIDAIRRSRRQEIFEGMVAPDGPGAPMDHGTVRYVMGAGAAVSTIMMSRESRKIKVTTVEQVGGSSLDIRTVLERFGEIEKFEEAPKSDMSSATHYITYFRPESAQLALCADENKEFIIIESCVVRPAVELARSNIDAFTVRVIAPRRPYCGYGFVEFDEPEDFSRVRSKVDLLEMKRYLHAPATCIHVSENKKNSDQLYLQGVPQWANPLSVKTAFMNKVSGLTPYFRVTLPREKAPSPAVDANAIESLTAQINFKLTSSQISDDINDDEIISLEDFVIVPQRNKEHYPFYNIGIDFSDPRKAVKAAELLNGVQFRFGVEQATARGMGRGRRGQGRAQWDWEAAGLGRDFDFARSVCTFPLEASIEMRVSFFVVPFIFQQMKRRIADEKESLEHEGVGQVDIFERQYGAANVTLTATSVDGLRTAKTRLGDLINGSRMDLNEQQLMNLKQFEARKAIKTIQNEMNTLLRIDDRNSALFVHGQRAEIIAARRRVMDYIDSDTGEPVREIKLRSTVYPLGLMKALVLKYGPNLEGVKKDFPTASVELVLRKHIIQAKCTDAEFEQMKQIVEDCASKLPGVANRKEQEELMPECPICLTAVTLNACYIMEYCGHYYCMDCARNLIDNAIRNNEIPIHCATEGCNEPLVLQDFKNLTIKEDRLRSSALRAFVQTNSSRYSYCLTADCRMIYRKWQEPGVRAGLTGSSVAQVRVGDDVQLSRTDVEFVCSLCRSSICTKCNVTYHQGITCNMYQRFKEIGDVPLWLEGDKENRSLCPKCAVPIQKDGGCMHMECTVCHAHICWRCKEVFPDSNSTYDHLGRCGGIF